MILSHLDQIISRCTEAARSGTLNQSLMLIGPEGIGKFKIVLELARVFLCEREFSSCGACAGCLDVARLQHPDFLLAFPFPNISPESKKYPAFHFSDPASTGARYSEDTLDAVEKFMKVKLDDPFAIIDFEKKENIPVEIIKDIIHALGRKPLRGGRRVVAILDIDKMAYGASDLFLKTVEEPPLNAHLIMTTSRPELLPQTLLSRTLRINIPGAPEADLIALLKGRLEINSEEATFLARFSKGSPGIAFNCHENEIIERRAQILKYLNMVIEQKLGSLINELDDNYKSSAVNFDEIKLDFEIIETLIHDLHVLNENGLEKSLINVDIITDMNKFVGIDLDTLGIWLSCCIETKKACLVNNVTFGAGMIFLFSCFDEAMRRPFKPLFKLP